MKRSIIAAAALGAVLLSTTAFAASLTLPPPGYSGSEIVNPDGTLPSDPVIQQDKTWSDFSASTNLAGQTVSFLFSTVGGVDFHTVSVTLPSLTAGEVVTFDYTIAINSTGVPGLHFDSAAGDIAQNTGSSSLVKDIIGGDTPYTIDFTKTGGSTYTGTQSVTFLPGTTLLTVDDTFTAGSGGTNAGSFQDTFTQSSAVPELSTWAMLGLGFAGLAFAGFRGRGTAVSIA
jgi:hypothetical protein